MKRFLGLFVVGVVVVGVLAGCAKKKSPEPVPPEQQKMGKDLMKQLPQQK